MTTIPVYQLIGHRDNLPFWIEEIEGAVRVLDEFGPEAPSPPRQVPSDQVDEARITLREATRSFLLRFYRAHMLEKDAVVAMATRVGTGFEAFELERVEPPVPDPLE